MDGFTGCFKGEAAAVLPLWHSFTALLEAMPKGPFTSAVAIEMYIIFQHQQLMISHPKKIAYDKSNTEIYMYHMVTVTQKIYMYHMYSAQ